jgi:predicted metal-dependent HD superfamily phosphohydrolase
MDKERNLIEESEKYVKDIFFKEENKNFFYHNWEHTQIVRKVALEIGRSEELSEEQLEDLELAAIFHDVAYFMGKESHEKNSAQMAEEFLLERNHPAERVGLVKRIILATDIQYVPQDLLERIIQDADISHLGNNKYFKTSYRTLLKEINTNAVCGTEIEFSQWERMCVDFMNTHSYHTQYALENFEKQKQKNLKTLKKMLDKAKEEGVKDLKEFSESEASILPKKKKNKNKGTGTEKGVETMFRVSLRNHVNLSQIADNKANTLISVNAIIISIALSTLFPKMDSNPHVVIPGIALILFSIMTIIMSILSTIPKTTHGVMSRSDVESKKGNLLFFGNFHNMSLDEYEWGVNELMQDRDYLYKSLTRDLYFLGKVLEKKYKLLRYSYYTFISGLLISIILFIVYVRTVV